MDDIRVRRGGQERNIKKDERDEGASKVLDVISLG